MKEEFSWEKRYTVQDIINFYPVECLVATNRDEYQFLLEELEFRGFKWISGEPPTAHPEYWDEMTAYGESIILDLSKSHKIGVSNINYYENPIVPIEAFLKRKTEIELQIW